jgi:predicted permease
MNEIHIIINQIIILTLLGITGFVAGRKKVLPDNSHKYISALILKITMPFLIFTTMGNYSFTGKTLTNGLYVFLFGIVFILFSGLVALGSCNIMGIKDKTSSLIFLMEGLLLGVMGAILGVAIGLLLGAMFTRFAVNPDGTPVVELYIDYGFIGISAIIALASAAIAALIPARRSSKLNPIEVIRNG